MKLLVKSDCKMADLQKLIEALRTAGYQAKASAGIEGVFILVQEAV